jgi:hypothetical protein
MRLFNVNIPAIFALFLFKWKKYPELFDSSKIVKGYPVDEHWKGVKMLYNP